MTGRILRLSCALVILAVSGGGRAAVAGREPKASKVIVGESVRLPHSAGKVYEVRLMPGAPFVLELPAGEYARNIWFDHAVDVVVYQGYFEEGNSRRVCEVLELEKPGVEIGVGGEIVYRYRRLVDWREGHGCSFPCRPSRRLLAGLERKALPWPRIRLEARGGVE